MEYGYIEELFLEMLREEIYSYLHLNAERCYKAFEFDLVIRTLRIWLKVECDLKSVSICDFTNMYDYIDVVAEKIKKERGF